MEVVQVKFSQTVTFSRLSFTTLLFNSQNIIFLVLFFRYPSDSLDFITLQISRNHLLLLSLVNKLKLTESVCWTRPWTFLAHLPFVYRENIHVPLATLSSPFKIWLEEHRGSVLFARCRKFALSLGGAALCEPVKRYIDHHCAVATTTSASKEILIRRCTQR